MTVPVSTLLRTVVWASDGAADEHPVGHFVGELCERYGSRLWIVHVVQTILPAATPSIDLHGGEERAIAWLKARTRALRRQGVDASLQVIRGVVGSPAPAIVQITQAVDADLMVLHPHERRAAGSIGTAGRLLASSPCPVLVLGSQLHAPQDPPAPNGRSTVGHRQTTYTPNESRNRCLNQMPTTSLNSAADALRS